MNIVFKILFFVLILNTTIFGIEYAVISNKNMKKLSKSQIKAIFLKKISIIDDIKVLPINLSTREELRRAFESHILNMSFMRLSSYWAKQHYLGQRPPLSIQSQQSVKAFVKKVDGAIGYINANEIDNELKILYRWED